jgi:uncharacterized membrane protein
MKVSKRLLLWLKEEIEIWRQEEIISEEQAERLQKRYDLFEIKEKAPPSRLITILSIIGSLLVGAGIILFIASNWQAIPKIGKLAIIFGMIFVVNHFGYYFKYTKGNYPKIGSALLFLGALLFGAGIWLIAQIYHITSRYHSGVLFWAMGISPVAWLLNLQPLLVLSSGLLSFWGVWKCYNLQIPNYPYLFLMLTIFFPLCYKQKAKTALFLSLVGFSVWFGFGVCGFHLRGEELLFVIPCLLAFGVLLYSVGLLHSLIQKIARYQLIYKFLGSIILLGFTYFLSFRSTQEWIKGVMPERLFPTPFWFIFGTISLLSICVIFGGFFLSRKRPQYFSKVSDYEITFLILSLLYSLLIFVVAFYGVFYYGVLSNLMLLALTIGLIFFGYYTKHHLFAKLGIIFFAIHFFTRYIDWGWRYLPRSIFFILAGVILLFGAILLERKRRRFIERGKSEQKG